MSRQVPVEPGSPRSPLTWPLIAIDESGSTGENLLDPAQPLYVLASVFLGRDEAHELVGDGRRELHFAEARNSEAGRARVLEVLNSQLLSSDKVRVAAVHKPFMVTAKMVDLLAEPVLHEAGLDLYSSSATVNLSSLWHLTFPVLGGSQEFQALQESFVGLLRRPSAGAKRACIKAYHQFERTITDEEMRPHLDLLQHGLRTYQIDYGSRVLPSLQPAVPCIEVLMQAWWDFLKGPFQVVHDEQSDVASWISELARMWGAQIPFRFTSYDGWVVEYPRDVRAFTFARSHEEPELQVADVVAGATEMLLRAMWGTSRDQRFEARLSETPTLTWLSRVVAPTKDFTDVSAKGTSFAMDRLAEWHSDIRGKRPPNGPPIGGS